MIERTFDYRKVVSLVPWKPVISIEVIYLLDGPDNLWAFERFRDGFMVHAQMGLNCRGKKAFESARKAFKWILVNTGMKTIYAGIPVDRKRVFYAASGVGMKYINTEKNKRFYKTEL